LKEKQINSYVTGDFKRRNLYINNGLYKELSILAAESNTDKSNILNLALLRYITEQKGVKRK
jgi:hypothetical protein